MSNFTNDQSNQRITSAKEGIFFGPIYSQSLARKNILLGMIGACLYGGLMIFGVVVFLLSSGLMTGHFNQPGQVKAVLIGSLTGMTIEALGFFALGFFTYRGAPAAAIIALAFFVLEK